MNFKLYACVFSRNGRINFILHSATTETVTGHDFFSYTRRYS